jgi:hypothetical protein
MSGSPGPGNLDPGCSGPGCQVVQVLVVYVDAGSTGPGCNVQVQGAQVLVLVQPLVIQILAAYVLLSPGPGGNLSLTFTKVAKLHCKTNRCRIRTYEPAWANFATRTMNS